MFPHLRFDDTQILAFALILIRTSAFTVSWPVFSVYSVPNVLKILFSVTLALLMFPVISRAGLTTGGLGTDVAWLALKEALAGLCLGFMTRMFFFAVSVGGNLTATSMGLQSAQMFNPALGSQSTTVEQFYNTLATLLFLALNGHHFFLSGLAQSFVAIPLSLDGIDLAAPMMGKGIGPLLQQVTEAGIKISAPVMVVIFVMNVAMGILGRAVPQINVLVTSLPVNIMAGLLVILVAIPALLLEMDHQVVGFAERLFEFMKAL